MIKRALLLLLLTAVWAFGSWWYYTCMIKGFCRTNGTFTSATDRAKTLAATGAAAVTATAVGLASDNTNAATPSTDDNAAANASDDSATPTNTDDAATDGTASENNATAPKSEDDTASGTDTGTNNGQPNTTNTPDTSETPTATPTTTSEFVDQDNDAISDEDERRLGTDPTKNDSDGDGVLDNEELGTDLQNPIDTDGDGVIDALDDDDDNDTLSSADEKALGTNPRNADTDDDALSDAQEVKNDKIGTDPLKPDTDNDGVSDGTEVGSEPNQPMDTDKDGTIDALDEDDDNDGIPTAIETQLNSDPLNQDSDNDGISDGKEIGDNPSQPIDSDGDGIIDLIDPAPQSSPTQDGADAATATDDSQGTAASNQSQDQVTVSKSTDNTGSANIPIQKSRLYFPSRSANPGLSEAATSYFTEVATWLNASKSHTVVLTGHTDNVGKAKNNLDLGLKRAIEIKNLMVKLGANASQIDVASMGETQPIASNETDSGRHQNRRVELIPALKQ